MKNLLLFGRLARSVRSHRRLRFLVHQKPKHVRPRVVPNVQQVLQDLVGDSFCFGARSSSALSCSAAVVICK
jgi:hypothetical protein